MWAVKEIKKIQELPVTEEELAQAKAKYVGDFVLALEPSTIVRYALSILTEGLAADFYTTYRKSMPFPLKIFNVTQKYIHLNNARVFVTEKGSEVLENLEKATPLGSTLNLRFFDKFGNETERPNYDALFEGVTASILEVFRCHYRKREQKVCVPNAKLLLPVCRG